MKAIRRVASIPRAQPAFGFEDCQTVSVTAILALLLEGSVFCLGVRKQQKIRNILAAFLGRRMLAQEVGPAKFRQNLHDKIVLGIGLDRRVDGSQLADERIHRCVVELLPNLCLFDAFREEVRGEKLTLHRASLWFARSSIIADFD